MKALYVSFAVALAGAISLLGSTSPRHDSRADDPVRLRIDVDRSILPADAREKAVVKVGLDGLELPRRELRPPVNLALVIDKSGSMSGDKIVKAREAALEAIARLGPDDVVALIAYDTTVHTLVPAQRVGDGRRLRDAVGEIVAGGNTALYGGVARGAAELRRYCEDGRYVNRIILLSDGLANVGPSSANELGRLGASLLKEGISVTTIGLGLGFNEDLMTQLAQCSDGNTYFVENSSDLPRIFAAELGNVLSIVARRIVIEIEFPQGVRPLCFVGRDGVIRGQRAELILNQLYSGQEKFVLVEVEIAPAPAGADREIARARVSYENALTQRSGVLTASQRVQFSTSRSAVVDSANHRVQSDYAANVMALAKDEAVSLVDANRRDAAAAELRAKAEALRQMGRAYSNASVLEISAAAAPQADRVEKEGLSNAERKVFRTESAQTRAQQAVPGSR